MTWLTRTAEGETPLHGVLALRPPLLDGYTSLLGHLWNDAGIDPVILELCRLRIAQLHRSDGELSIRHRSAVEAGLSEEMVAALPRYGQSGRFSEHQRSCIGYAELFVIDAHAITDDDFAAMAAGFTPEAVVAFSVALALFDGVGRLRLVLELASPFEAVTVVPSPSSTGPIY